MGRKTHSFPLRLLRMSVVLAVFTSSLAFGRDLVQGRKLYQANCASCHGMNAKGSAQAAKALQVDPLKLDLTRPKVVLKPTAELTKLISGGHGKMPRQKTWLTPSQIRSVISYLQSLQRAYASGKEVP